MPEGPEVETVRRTLEPHLVGHALGTPRLSGKRLRFPETPDAFARVATRPIRALGRHGKLLWLELGDFAIEVHLGMSGQLVYAPDDAVLKPHTHVHWPLPAAPGSLRYVDPRRFGAVRVRTPDELGKSLARLGPDPTVPGEGDLARFLAKIRGTSRSLKAALLDQSVVAGVGNIYACEALFQAGLDPHTPGSALSKPAATRLYEACEAVLLQGVKNRGTTFGAYVDGEGNAGENLAQLAVFRRENAPCPTCEAPIARTVQSGRSTFWCPTCQKKPRARPRATKRGSR